MNAVFGMIPDALIGVAVAHVTSTGLAGFLWTVLGLQALYFALWLKRATWSWLFFCLWGRRKWVANIYAYLRENEYPEPEWRDDPEDYFQRTANAKPYLLGGRHIPCELRMKAISELAFINALRMTGQARLFYQTISACEHAIERYREDLSGETAKRASPVAFVATTGGE
jgi:hypothetical protein